jgi:hypothetical protein
MADVTINEGTSASDAELTLYIQKAAVFTDDTLKAVGEVPLHP